MFDRRSLVVVGLALVVGLSACSGGDPAALPDTSGGVAESQTTETDSVAEPGGGFDAAAADQIERAASAALEQFVDFPIAGTAIVTAYDNGFSFAQIVGALDTGALSEIGTIDGIKNPEALDRFQLVAYQPGQLALFYVVDVEALAEALARAQGEFGAAGIEEMAPGFFLELILWAVSDGYSVEVIVEAIVLGSFTEATRAEMEAHSRDLRLDETRDEIDYCRSQSAMGTVTGLHINFDECVLQQTGETVEELFGAEADNESDQPSDEPTEDGDDGSAVGSGGLGANPGIPGPDGSMASESITLNLSGDTATVLFDLAFTTAVEYVDGSAVCHENFTLTSGASNLAVNGATVTGTTEVILNFEDATLCPETEQEDIGVPQLADITGRVDGPIFSGELSFAGLAIPFSAVVSGG